MREYFDYLVAIVQLGFFVFALNEIWYRDWAGLFVAFQAIAISFLPWILKRWFDIYTPYALRIGIVLFMFSTLILGEVADFYNKFWWWDVILHGVASAGLALIGFIFLFVFFKQSELRSTPLFTTVLAISFALAAAVVWELYEFIIDIFFETDSPMQPDNFDTMTDLAIATVMALLVGVGGFRFLRWREKNMLGEVIAKTAARNK